MPGDEGEGMKVYTSTIQVASRRPRELVDITEAAREEVRKSGIESGLCGLYAHGATAALMIQENDDPQVPEDVLFERLAGRGRADDTPEVIRQRLVAYREQTEPLLAYYGQRNMLKSIDGQGTIDEVFQRAGAVLDPLKN